MLAALAWRNLWRRPQRTVLSLISIALVTALLVFMLSFQEGVYGVLKEATLRIFDGYAQLQPPGWADDPTLDRAIEHPVALARQAEGLRGVTAAAPRVNAFAILAHGARSYGAAVVGVDPARERRVSSIASTIGTGRYLAAGDTDAAILGETLARNLNLRVGDAVTVLGEARDGSVAADVLHVVGLYHSGVPDLDRSILEMPLARAQDAFGMEGAASTIALGGPSLAAVDNGDSGPANPRSSGWSLGARLGGPGAGHARRHRAQVRHRDDVLRHFGGGGGLHHPQHALDVVLERTREFGMLLALGMRPGQIGAMVWIELLGLALLGCLFGLLLGGGVTLWLQRVGIVVPIDPRLLAQFALPDAPVPDAHAPLRAVRTRALLAAIIVGGVVPYLRVTGLTPALAMRAP